MKVKLFGLNRGDRFILNNKEYTVEMYKYKFMPTLGKVLNCVCFDEKGNTQMFIRDWDVKPKPPNNQGERREGKNG
jgi:hypothetical protein